MPTSDHGYLCSAGTAPQRRDLTEDAKWLAAPLAIKAGPGRTRPRSRRRPNWWVRAARLRRPGRYQIQAAIVACHAEAAT